jgi:serine/threonine-protein kinase
LATSPEVGLDPDVESGTTHPSPSAPKPERVAAITRALGEHYRLEVGPEGGVALLGRGGMATVYLAEDVRHDRWVAVKVLHPELAASIGPQRFLREIRIAAQLHHPHILGLIDSGEANGILYYVMPFVTGESLRAHIEKVGPLPLADVVRLLRDVASALGRAHKAGIVHRDIKPENILLEDRHALVTDFGVAKAVSEATRAGADTSVGFALGTPAYMAPEQAAADEIDHRADIYALGIVAYEMLTGSLPFEARTPQQMIAAHLAKPPAPLRGKRADVPVALERVVMHCLEKDPDDRWQTADDMILALEELPSMSAIRPAVPAPKTLEMPVGRDGAPEPARADADPPVPHAWGAARWMALTVVAVLIGLAVAAKLGWLGG